MKKYKNWTERFFVNIMYFLYIYRLLDIIVTNSCEMYRVIILTYYVIRSIVYTICIDLLILNFALNKSNSITIQPIRNHD